MAMKKVKVVYIGPGADVDPRELEVTEEEAEALIARGTWKTKRSRKKEVSDA
jgi:hypothetical protein